MGCSTGREAEVADRTSGLSRLGRPEARLGLQAERCARQLIRKPFGGTGRGVRGTVSLPVTVRALLLGLERGEERC